MPPFASAISAPSLLELIEAGDELEAREYFARPDTQVHTWLNAPATIQRIHYWIMQGRLSQLRLLGSITGHRLVGNAAPGDGLWDDYQDSLRSKTATKFLEAALRHPRPEILSWIVSTDVLETVDYKNNPQLAMAAIKNGSAEAIAWVQKHLRIQGKTPLEAFEGRSYCTFISELLDSGDVKAVAALLPYIDAGIIRNPTDRELEDTARRTTYKKAHFLRAQAKIQQMRENLLIERTNTHLRQP